MAMWRSPITITILVNGANGDQWCSFAIGANGDPLTTMVVLQYRKWHKF
jgi:hypothetical protein